MTVAGFSASVPLHGSAGYTNLMRTQSTQMARLASNTQVKREVAYFKATIATATTPAKLLADNRLRTFVMTAFNLTAQAPYKGFAQKILAADWRVSTSLPNTLSDKRWLALSKGLDFADSSTVATRFANSTFVQGIVDKYMQTQWQDAVTATDGTMGNALYAKGQLATLAAATNPSWYSVIADAGLRDVFQNVFHLSSAFWQLDVDRQNTLLQDANLRVYGNKSLSVFNTPATLSKLINRYLDLSQSNTAVTNTSASSVALLSGDFSTLASSNLSSTSTALNLMINKQPDFFSSTTNNIIDVSSIYSLLGSGNNKFSATLLSKLA